MKSKSVPTFQKVNFTAPTMMVMTLTDRGWTKKVRPQTRGHNSVKSEISIFFTGSFPGKFAVMSLLKIPPHFAYVARYLV